MDDLDKILIIGASVFLSSVLSAVAGIGSGFIVIAALSLFFDIKVTLAFFAILSVFSSASKVSVYYKTIDIGFFKTIVLGLIPGLFIGLSIFRIIPERPVELFMGLLGIYLVAEHFIKLPRVTNFTNPVIILCGFIWGVIGGAASAGPVKVMLLKWRGMDKYHFVGTSAVLSLFMDGYKVFGYVIMGFISFSQIFILLPSIILNILGTYIGKKILDNTSQLFFEYVMLVMIFIGSCKFLFF